MTHIESLLEEYQRVRRVDINKDIFIYILKLYPSLLVCMSECDEIGSRVSRGICQFNTGR